MGQPEQNQLRVMSPAHHSRGHHLFNYSINIHFVTSVLVEWFMTRIFHVGNCFNGKGCTLTALTKKQQFNPKCFMVKHGILIFLHYFLPGHIQIKHLSEGVMIYNQKGNQ